MFDRLHSQEVCLALAPASRSPLPLTEMMPLGGGSLPLPLLRSATVVVPVAPITRQHASFCSARLHCLTLVALN